MTKPPSSRPAAGSKGERAGASGISPGHGGRELDIERALCPTARKDLLLLASYALVGVVLVVELLDRIGHVDVAGWRPWLGVGIAVGVTGLASGWSLSAASPAGFIHRLLAAAGGVIVIAYVVASLASAPIQPTLMWDAFLVAGTLALGVGAFGLATDDARVTVCERRPDRPEPAVTTVSHPFHWYLDLLAVALVWLVAVVSMLGVFFDPSAPLWIIHLGALAIWACLATVALVALLTEGRARQAVGALPKAAKSGVTLAAVLAAVVTGYGLWYSYIVGPTDVPPSVDLRISIGKAADAGPESGAQPLEDLNVVTVTLRNTSGARVALLGDVLNVFTADDDPFGPDDLLLHAEGANEQNFYCLVRAAIKGHAQPACLNSRADGLAKARPNGPRQAAWGRQREFRHQLTGRLWSTGEWLEPGSETEVSVVVPTASDADIVRAEANVLIARADRLMIEPAPIDAPSECSFRAWPREQFRRLGGDPVTNLIAAHSPSSYELAWRPEWVIVPDVRGLPARKVARVQLGESGLLCECSDCDPDAPVTEQSPPPGTTVRSYVVREGAPSELDVAVSGEPSATDACRVSDDALDGLVTPPIVKLQTEVPAEALTVPGVVRQSVGDALAELRTLGLTGRCEDCELDGAVISQDPPRWAAVEPGETVIVRTSRDPEAQLQTHNALGIGASWRLWLCDYDGSDYVSMGADLSLGKSDAAESSIAEAVAVVERPSE